MEIYEAASSITYTNAENADSGFANLSYKGRSMVLDQAHPDVTAGSLPTYHMLNSKYLGMFWNASGVGAFVESIDQDAKVAKMITEVQLVTNNRRRQGKISFTS